MRATVSRPTTGRKCTPSGAVQQAKSALRPRNIVGHVQHGRAGFGFGERGPTWHKASSTGRGKLVVEEVWRQEQADRCIKAVSQSKQGQWTSWDNLEHCKLTWRDVWERSRLSFIIRATYDVLPTPKNLHWWLAQDPTCALCETPARHILTWCKTSLSQGATPGDITRTCVSWQSL